MKEGHLKIDISLELYKGHLVRYIVAYYSRFPFKKMRKEKEKIKEDSIQHMPLIYDCEIMVPIPETQVDPIALWSLHLLD